MSNTTGAVAGLPQQLNSNDTEEFVRRCRACASSALHVDWAAGDRVCTDCGLVDEEHLLDERAEWREFDDDNDLAKNAAKGGGSSARCGMVATNEQNWIGGLQPTSLSRHVFGGPTKTSSATRKKLVKANQRMDFLMEKSHAKDISNVKLSMKIRDRKRRMGQDYTTAEAEDTDRPELEELLVQEEESALVKTAALYADKWSLDRAIRLCGKGHEMEALPSSGRQQSGDNDDDEGNNKGLDETLTNAARDLYAAYTMLNECARRLDLPERVINEATATMVKYAARRDGLSVRGVSSQLKQIKKTDADDAAAKAAATQAREALREYNKLKQIGSLIGAILFYTSRNLSYPRSLVQVCASLETPTSTMIHSNPYLDISNNNNKDKNKESTFIKKKHCSKAMTEIKQVFPDLTRNLTGAAAAASGQQSLLMNDTTSTETVLEHVLRKLRLPLVAQASVRTLVQQQEQMAAAAAAAEDSLKTKKRFVMCAAVTYFVCLVGEIMQNLATQASTDTSMARPVIVPREKRRKLSHASSIGSTDSAAFPAVSLSSMDTVSEEEAKEHKAYEMRRVWDAWRDQTPWKRTPPEIEHASGVTLTSIELFFKTVLYPNRKALLEALTQKSKLVLTTHDDDDPTSAAGQEHDSMGLSRVPLASVLLPYVTVTEPLIKETIPRQKVS